MGKVTGFKEFPRTIVPYRDEEVRINDFDEIFSKGNTDQLKLQGARCMDCGVPFCQSDDGCPVDNLIPEWNDLIYRGEWRAALERLQATNNFPEFTGRVCPAPCEGACVLGISEPAVTICKIEEMIAEVGFEKGLIKPKKPESRTGKKIAVVGSGPAGMACADQLNSVGHKVTVFEKEDRVGGLLMYGIPHFKLDKEVVKRRINVMEESGVIFKTGVNV
ncbi:MAG: NAD(P)-binding protein, partial [Proteobacteria bacterium]|nr:NAD(P)-binding protein [Pseudomonadota bacterium]